MDMAVLVEAQGDMINNIETHVSILYFCIEPVVYRTCAVFLFCNSKLDGIIPSSVSRSRTPPTTYSKV
jgi:hypothetical protein